MGTRLSISVAGLRRDDPAAPWASGARAAIDWAGTLGVRAIQLDASAPGLRARELDRSARRDLAALLRRNELLLTGLDLWLPGEHLIDPAQVDRAAAAIIGAIGLAGELAPLAGGGRLVSVHLPARVGDDVLATIVAEADRQGVRVADHAWPPRGGAGGRVFAGAESADAITPGGAEGSPALGLGLDPAAVALAGESIATVAARVAGEVLSARLCDLSSAGRVLPGSADGRLDLVGYKVGLSLSPGEVPVVIDLRGLHEQDAAARRMASDWARA